jgi:hypothetical protein
MSRHLGQRIDGELANKRTAKMTVVTSTGTHNQECPVIAEMATEGRDTWSMWI